jgi:hypothetical protein
VPVDGGGPAGGRAKLTSAEVRILPPPLVDTRLKLSQDFLSAECSTPLRLISRYATTASSSAARVVRIATKKNGMVCDYGKSSLVLYLQRGATSRVIALSTCVRVRVRFLREYLLT